MLAGKFGQWTFGILLIVVVGLPLLWRPSRASSKTAAATLVVLTPHNEHIRYELGRGFREWHRREFGAPVEIDWRFYGSSDMTRLLSAQYEALARKGREDKGSGYDIAIGGGDHIFNKNLKGGVTVTDDAGNKRTVSITQPVHIDQALLAEVYPQAEIAGRKVYDLDGHWFGVVLSTFGIVYNRDLLRARGIPEPTTWSDLTDPRYYGWVGMVDPSHSGSIRTTYEAVVQRYGFDKGWRTLREISANARYFAPESSQTPVDVANGEVLAGLCVDHYARYQAQVIGRGRLDYVAPPDATVVNPDPVAVLRGTERRELAERFVRYLLSRAGQSVWCLPVGAPDGPERYELLRPPARQDMYSSGDSAALRDNPFVTAKPLPPGTPGYFDVLPTVLHAMVIDVHAELKRAWGVILNEADVERRARMLAVFHELPFTQEELLAAGKRWANDKPSLFADRVAWTNFFRERYQRVVAMRGR